MYGKSIRNAQLSIFHLLNYNFNSYKPIKDDKEQGICIEEDYFVILYISFIKFTL